MKNKAESNRITMKIILKLAGGLAAIVLASLLSIAFWQYTLLDLYIDPDMVPRANLVILLAGVPALIIYLIWFLVLRLGYRPPLSNSTYKPLLWTCAALVLTFLLQLILSMIFGLMGEMMTPMVVATVLVTAAAALDFFALRPW